MPTQLQFPLFVAKSWKPSMSLDYPLGDKSNHGLAERHARKLSAAQGCAEEGATGQSGPRSIKSPQIES